MLTFKHNNIKACFALQKLYLIKYVSERFLMCNDWLISLMEGGFGLL